MTNFIHEWTIQDKQICDDLIQYHKDQKEYKGSGLVGTGEEDKDIKDSTDVAFWPGSQSPIIKKYFKLLQIGLNDYLAKYPFVDTMSLWSKEPTNIQHYLPNGGYHSWHFERNTNEHPMISRGLVFMTYLNDVTDKGETEWYYQNYKIQPKKGLSVIWPTDFTHTHRGIPSPTQEKYIVTGWWNITK